MHIDLKYNFKVITSLYFLVFCSDFTSNAQPKINGASIVNPPRPTQQEVFVPMTAYGIGWVSIIPYAFSRAGSPQVSYDNGRQWWGETSEGTRVLIQQARANNLKILLKPHVWIGGQGWPGEFTLATEADWKIWEAEYRRYILNHAHIAEETKVDIFCVGTEFRLAAKNRPDYWRSLIAEVRGIYSGKITYAANWDNYENIQFWDLLDYIGIDAYFPLCQDIDPSIRKLKESWQPIKSKIKQISVFYNKKILFTEYGYQSRPQTAGNHWELEGEAINLLSQANAYEALLSEFWEEKWFIGGFFWKWHFQGREDPNNKDFTPQGKPALQVIKNYYSSGY